MNYTIPSRFSVILFPPVLWHTVNLLDSVLKQKTNKRFPSSLIVLYLPTGSCVWTTYVRRAFGCTTTCGTNWATPRLCYECIRLETTFSRYSPTGDVFSKCLKQRHDCITRIIALNSIWLLSKTCSWRYLKINSTVKCKLVPTWDRS